DFDNRQAGRSEDKQIDLVDAPLVIHEFEIRPRPPGIMIRQVLAKELQSLAFPLVRGGADNDPSRRLHVFPWPPWLPGVGAGWSGRLGAVSMNCRMAWRMTHETDASR